MEGRTKQTQIRDKRRVGGLIGPPIKYSQQRKSSKTMGHIYECKKQVYGKTKIVCDRKEFHEPQAINNGHGQEDSKINV